MLRVKICGLTRYEDARLACELGADALGFIFYPQSKRFIAPEKAAGIIEGLPPFVTKVGVFVNHPATDVNQLAAQIGLDVVQLHGDESPEYCAQLQVPVIKAFRVKSDNFDVGVLRNYRCSGYLLDSYHPERYGGTGMSFDWRLAKEAREHGHLILSGGLTRDNVAAAIQSVRPDAVDVCSGVEAVPGQKHREKLIAFMRELLNFRQRFEHV